MVRTSQVRRHRLVQWFFSGPLGALSFQTITNFVCFLDAFSLLTKAISPPNYISRKKKKKPGLMGPAVGRGAAWAAPLFP